MVAGTATVPVSTISIPTGIAVVLTEARAAGLLAAEDGLIVDF